MNFAGRVFWSALCLLLVAPVSASQPPASMAPRGLSAAERAAVELAVAYVQGGPSAWWVALAEEAPLKKVGQAAAIRELETRLGAAGAASWELLTLLGDPSPQLAAFRLELPGGIDDLVWLELVEKPRAGWKLLELHHWADPLALPAESSAEKPKREAAPPLSPARRLLGLAGMGLTLVFALLALVLGRVRPKVALASLGLALSAAVVGGLAVLLPAGTGSPPVVATKAAAGSPFESLRQAQQAFQVGEVQVAKRLLNSLPSPSPYPLAEVLRARLAQLEENEVETVLFYQRAIRALPPVDSLQLEKLLALDLGGFHDRAKDALAALGAGGSRNAEILYLLARVALAEGDEGLAKSRLRLAWELAPMERGDLLADPYFAWLVVRGDLFQRLRLGRPQEPTVGASDLGSQAITLPPGFSAGLSGRKLRLARGQSVVTVPGGSALAPAGTVVEDAAEVRRRRELEALASLGSLKEAAKAPSALAQPALRQRLEVTAEALARRQRWLDLVELTQHAAAHPERLPAAVMHLRADGLAKTYGPEEATRFMLLVAKSRAVERRRDPYALLRLAHHLKDAEQFELAVQVASRAEAQLPEPPAVSMLPRIHMERQLATAYQVHETRHFRLRFPSAERTYLVVQVGQLLERELGRLKRWIPGEPRQKIGIDLFPFRDFMTHYSMGGHAIGLFDGKVRVPFADARGFNSFLVSVLSHELAHALIADSTGDKAPAWFHEGLAQHIEMGGTVVNPIADLRTSGKLLAFPLLEPVFTSRVHPSLVTLAYSEAAWALHAIEGRYGVATIHRLLSAFGKGQDTEEAIGAVLGLSQVEFDSQIWDWCERRGPRVWSRPVVEYRLGE